MTGSEGGAFMSKWVSGSFQTGDGTDEPLFRRKITTELPTPPIGADLAMVGIADDGAYYFCKDDKGHRAIRATEFLCSRLGEHVGIPTSDSAVIEGLDGRTYFGSKRIESPESDLATRTLLTTPQTNELGGQGIWPGAYLSTVYAFDLFVSNPDRVQRNFISVRDGLTRRLHAIDFASARLDHWTARRFPVATENTIIVGRVLRGRHGFTLSAALEIIDRLAAVPLSVIEAILVRMPDDWLDNQQRGEIVTFWSTTALADRLAQLRSGLSDESLL